MSVKTNYIKLSTQGNSDVIDITPQVAKKLAESGLSDGAVTIFVAGSTAALTTVEYEPGLVRDIKELFEKIAPSNKEYHHNERWHDDNGHSHVRASLVGPSLTIPFVDKKLTLGTWQQVVLIDFDNRARKREIALQFMGE